MKKYIPAILITFLLPFLVYGASLEVLKVKQGGTGANTLTGCLTGNGTDPITGTGSACGSGGGGGTYPFTTSTAFGQTVSATSTPIFDSAGIMASSTSYLATLNAQTIGNIQYADQQAGADCGAKINTALTALGGNGGQVWVNTNCGSTISTAITMQQNQILQFAQCGTWTESALITGGHIFGLAPYGGSCTILKQAAGANLAYMFRPTHQFDNIKDMELDGTNGSNTGTIGVDVYRINGTVTDYNYIHNMPSYCWATETASENSGESDVNVFTNNYGLLNGSDCVHVNNSQDDIIDHNLIYYSTGYGIYLNNGGGTRISNNDISNATLPAIYATSTATALAAGRSGLLLNIDQNRFGNNSSDVVFLDGYTGSGYGVGASKITNNLFDGGSFQTSNTNDAIKLRDTTNNVVSGNIISSNVGNTYKYGIEVVDTGHAGTDTMFGNGYSGTFGTGVKNVKLGTTKDCDGVSCQLATLTTTGNVGVGTTTPGSLLSVGNTQGINFSTGTSTSNATGGFDLRGGGCFSISGTCIGGSGSGTINSGTNNQFAYYSGATTLSSSPILTFNNTQNTLAVGTTTSWYPFTVASSTALSSPQFALSAGTGLSLWTLANEGGNLYFSTTTTAGNATSTISALSIINATGRVGIDTSVPTAPLDVAGGGVLANFGDTSNASSINLSGDRAEFGYDGTWARMSGNGKALGFSISNSLSSKTMEITTASVVAMGGTITSDSVPTGATMVVNSTSAGVGTTSPWRIFSVQGTVALNGLSAFATGDSAICERAGGEITIDSGVSSCIVSSKFTKDYQGQDDYANAKKRIDALNVIEFKYKDSGKEDIGLFAEEVAKIDPRYAQYEDKEETIDGHIFHVGDPKAINWTAIQADMIVVIQHPQTSNSWMFGLLGLLGFIPLFIKRK